MTSNQYDAIIIGGGHNGLVAVVEEVHRARASGATLLRSQHGCENGNHGGASSSTSASEGGEVTVL